MQGDKDFSRAWDAMRANGDIQFSPVEIPVEAPASSEPGLFDDIAQWLGRLIEGIAQAMGASANLVFWALIILGAGLVLYFIYRVIDPQRFVRIRKESEDEESWAPEQGAALLLLEEADRLAQEGRFDEATHLLLRRSVGQIADIRPDLIDPSSTAREIATLPALPDAARNAFATIAERVERSLFALRSLEEADWQAARGAYSQFALGYKGASA